MNMVRKLACGVMCFAAMIASATTTTNFDFFVEYIQSSGTQWMDTGVIGKSTVNLSVDIMVLNTAGSSCIVGERASSSDKSQRLGLWVGGQYKFALNCGSIDSMQVGSAYQNTRCVVSNENGRLWVAAEGGIPTKIHNGGNQTFTSSLSMTVFFLNTATGLDMGSNRPLTARLYGMTIHDDGVLIRNFRPCRATIADANEGTSVSKYGLWDTVNDVFYGDLSGGADFTAPEQASDIVVEQNAHGLEGVEPPGPYIVDDNRTFSATNLTIGPISWVPVGYSLEKWDAGNGVWNYFKTEQGNSFAYTNNAENGRMRLTWLWTQTGNVRRYGLGDYIQTAGLVGHFDGIYNAGRSAAHAASPGTWVDLAGKFNLTRSGTSGFSADSWVANGSTFYTGSSAGPRDALIAGKFTLEMMISSPQIGSNSYGTWVFLGNNNDRQLCVDMRSANSQNPLIQGIQYLGGGSWNDGAVVQNWGGTKTKWNTRQYIAIVCDGNTATGYCDGTNQFHSITVPGVTPSLTQVGVGVRASDSGNKLINGAEICALRMTSQALEGWQLEHNSAVDHARFCNNVTVVNGAIGETGENGASSAPNGDYDLLSPTEHGWSQTYWNSSTPIPWTRTSLATGESASPGPGSRPTRPSACLPSPLPPRRTYPRRRRDTATSPVSPPATMWPSPAVLRRGRTRMGQSPIPTRDGSCTTMTAMSYRTAWRQPSPTRIRRPHPSAASSGNGRQVRSAAHTLPASTGVTLSSRRMRAGSRASRFLAPTR